jgi:hypothetical protein
MRRRKQARGFDARASHVSKASPRSAFASPKPMLSERASWTKTSSRSSSSSSVSSKRLPVERRKFSIAPACPPLLPLPLAPRNLLRRFLRRGRAFLLFLFARGFGSAGS